MCIYLNMLWILIRSRLKSIQYLSKHCREWCAVKKRLNSNTCETTLNA